MDGRIGHFSYLIEEVESGFFQKAAEEIAAEPSQEEAKTGPAVPERFQKLATLVYQSNQHGLVKQANESLFDTGNIGSYEDILNKVAASSLWEPLGMTKSALDYLDALEEAGIDGEELGKFASHILEDTLETDAVIEASINDDSCEDLSKIARLAVVKNLLSRAGKAIAKPGKFKAMGEAIQQRGIRDIAAAPFRRTGQAIAGKYRKEVGKMRQRARLARSKRLTSLQQQRMDVRKQFAAAPTSAKVELGNKLKGINKQIERQKSRVRDVARKQKATLRAATPKPAPAVRTPKAEAKAPAKSSAPEAAPSARPPKEAVEGKGVGVMDAWTKWGKEGWGALTDAEKSRLIRAGVMAGGGTAAYNVAFGD